MQATGSKQFLIISVECKKGIIIEQANKQCVENTDFIEPFFGKLFYDYVHGLYSMHWIRMNHFRIPGSDILIRII